MWKPVGRQNTQHLGNIQKRGPTIQSEESQKEKYCILMHAYAYGMQRDGTDESICSTAVQTQTQRTDFGHLEGKEKVGQIERAAWKHTLP